MTFGKKAFFCYTVKPLGEVYWFSNVPCVTEPKREELNVISNTDWKERLRELHAHDPEPIPNIIASAATEEMGKWAQYDLSPLRSWHKELVCLAGDSAHATSPSSGQGASLALEDGAVLSQCLRDIADTEQAFTRFEDLRKARVERIVQGARRAGSRKIPNPVAGWLRDLLLPAFLQAGGKAAKETYGYKVTWNEPVSG
jgi:2-polyprenyl-6-methoxyphenol hydroxylase-like FAD-dependent oxidoreductase